MEQLNFLKIDNTLSFNWNLTFNELIEVCKTNSVLYKINTNGVLKSISFPVSFANFKNAEATVYFTNKKSKKYVYITLPLTKEYSIEKYLEINEEMEIFFGKPKKNLKNESIWVLGDFKIKHYYFYRDEFLGGCLEIAK